MKFRQQCCILRPKLGLATSHSVCQSGKLLLGLASTVMLGSKSRGTHDHMLLSQTRDPAPPNLEGHVPVFISLSDKVAGPVIPPGTGFPFRRLLVGPWIIKSRPDCKEPFLGAIQHQPLINRTHHSLQCNTCVRYYSAGCADHRTVAFA
jgi:hypothetical protein